MYKILIVEDDFDLSDLVKIQLQKANYEVITAYSSKDAISIVQKEEVDLILLDIMLPDFEGTEACLEIRKYLYCPIIFMSAIDDQEYILKAFQNGGDDYITKPINYVQLLARIEAALRRSKNYSKREQLSESFTFGDFELKFFERLLLKNNKPVFLSPTQLSLLIYLVENKNMVMTYDQIFKDVWHQENIGDLRSLAVHISNLRNILGNSECIISVRGEGYKFDSSKI